MWGVQVKLWIPWERVPYTSALEVCSRRGVIQIHVYLTLPYISMVCDVCACDSSMVIRDLTLRSAASFGSFHLIRLLYDEYMFYIVEHKVAAAMQETSIAVMADYRQVAFSAA